VADHSGEENTFKFYQMDISLGTGHIRSKGLSRTAVGSIRRAVIRVYDETGNVIEPHQHKGEFKDS